MYTVGYSISLLCLLVAVFTLCYFKYVVYIMFEFKSFTVWCAA